jgi:hypothetical protein
MKNNNFEENLDKGNLVELFLSEYFEEVFKWKFVGGNIDGKIVNKSSIEEMFSCEYIPPIKRKRGHTLRFPDGEEVIMPDLLFKSGRGIVFWTESKSSYNSDYRTIDIEKDKIEAYRRIQDKTKGTVWIVVTFVSEKSYTIFSSRILEINEYIEKEELQSFVNSFYHGKECYRFNTLEYPFQYLTEVER